MARQPKAPPDAWQLALRLLTRRDYSSCELTARLRQRGCPQEEIEKALDRLQQLGYLDDRRYAQERCRELLRSGRGVGRKVLIDLQKKGIPPDLAEETLAAASSEFDSQEILRSQLARRFPGFDYNSAGDKERRRVVSFFQRRGFSLEQIFTELKK